MKLSPNIRYAIRILFELQRAHKAFPLASLSEKTGIAPRAIENVHNVLRKNGITAGIVGAKGGIYLSSPLKKISLGLLVQLLDNGVEFAVCCGDKANECPNIETCANRATWKAISAKFQKELDAVSLDAIMKQYMRKAGQEGIEVSDQNCGKGRGAGE
jgi:Rrf2 family protein